MIKSAVISDCGLYRYTLSRRWDDNPSLLSVVSPAPFVHKRVVFVCLNPSDADATDDDPTVRKMMGFARRYDASEVVVLNLFAYRTPYPAKLIEAMNAGADIIGPENDNHWRDIFMGNDVINGNTKVFFAWGALSGALSKFAEQRISLVSSFVPNPLCLRTTKDGQPWHPLYVPYDVVPKPWTSPGAWRMP